MLREVLDLDALDARILELADMGHPLTTADKAWIHGALDELRSSRKVVEAAEALQAVYSIKRPKPWSGDDGHLGRLWDRIDSVRSALKELRTVNAKESS